MERNALKQRLIGAIVLVSLAVIFIPMLLQGPDELDDLILSSNIPDAPKRKTEVIELKDLPPQPQRPPVSSVVVEAKTPKVTLEVNKGSVAEPPQAPSTSKSSAKKAEREKRDESKVPPSASTDKALVVPTPWSVQLGSFSHKENAISLRDKARRKGFSSYVEAYATSQGERYRVRVGPESSKEKAEALQARIKTKMGLNGLVLKGY